MKICMDMLQRTLLRLLVKPNTDRRIYKDYLPKTFVSAFPEGYHPTYGDFQSTRSYLESRGLAYTDEATLSHDNWCLVLTDDGRAKAQDIVKHYLTEEERKQIDVDKLKTRILLMLYDAKIEDKGRYYPLVRENLLLTLCDEPNRSGPLPEKYFREKYSEAIGSLSQEGHVTEEPIPTGGGSMLYLTAPGLESVLLGADKSNDSGIQGVEDPRKVFVVHGRDLGARDAIFEFLKSIGLHPVEWAEAVKATGETAPYIGTILNTLFSLGQAVLVLMTPDDVAYLKERFHQDDEPSHETKPTGQARPNVLFEAGMAMGRADKRTILVNLGSIRPFSDIAGRYVIRLDNSPKVREMLIQQLETAGCPVNKDSTDWKQAGNFEIDELSATEEEKEIGIAPAISPKLIVDMKKEYADDREKRGECRHTLRVLYDIYRDAVEAAESHKPPNLLEELLQEEQADAFPSGFDPPTEDNLLLFVKEHEDLWRDSLLWKFAKFAHPSEEDINGTEAEFFMKRLRNASISTPTFFRMFDSITDLAYFWDRWSSAMGPDTVNKNLDLDWTELIILTWLELAHVRKTGDISGRAGKTSFFILAKTVWESRRIEKENIELQAEQPASPKPQRRRKR